MFVEYELVRLRNAREGLQAGSVGTIVMAYESEPPGYEVEFADSEGVTIAILTLHDEDLEPANLESSN